MTVNSMYGIKDFVIPGEDPGSIFLRCPLQTAVGRNGSRIESGMTVKSVYGMTVFCHPGRRPGMTDKKQVRDDGLLSSRAKTRDPSCFAALCKRR
jgi:hypothetical protein